MIVTPLLILAVAATTPAIYIGAILGLHNPHVGAVIDSEMVYGQHGPHVQRVGGLKVSQMTAKIAIYSLVLSVISGIFIQLNFCA